jgi:uncharacterized protein with predicted RNA binding PUA domain
MPIARSETQLDINKPKTLLIEKILAILSYQFESDIFSDIMKPIDEISIEFSNNTGRMKNIFFKSVRILTFKPTVGLFNLSKEGAQLLKVSSKPPRFRVKLRNDVAEYVRQGKSAFAKHILEIDPILRIGSETIVVDEEDNFIAVGKLLIPSIMYTGRSIGAAVNVRKGNEEE